MSFGKDRSNRDPFDTLSSGRGKADMGTTGDEVESQEKSSWSPRAARQTKRRRRRARFIKRESGGIRNQGEISWRRAGVPSRKGEAMALGLCQVTSDLQFALAMHKHRQAIKRSSIPPYLLLHAICPAQGDMC